MALSVSLQSASDHLDTVENEGTPTPYNRVDIMQVVSALRPVVTEIDGLNDMPLGTLMRPMGGLYPAADLVTNAISGTLQSFTHQAATRWDSPAIGKQGQNWVAVNPANLDAGCINKTTPRVAGGNPLASTFDFSFVLTDTKFSLMFGYFGQADVQIYAEYLGQMCKLTATPVATTITGAAFYNVEFATAGARRIRVRASQGWFYQLLREQSTVIAPGPALPLAIIDGDSWVDAAGQYNSGSVRGTFYTGGIVGKIIEKTGWAVWQAAEGGTGAFNNGAGADSATPSATATTRWGSSQRAAYLATPLGQKAILYLLSGTFNDGSLSGGAANMQARIGAVYDALVAVDPGLPIVQVGPQPLNGGAVDDVNDLNRQGQIAAAAAHPNVRGYIDPRNIGAGTQWWTGTGSNQTPTGTTDQQATIIGADAVHPNYIGHQYYGERIVAELRNIRIPVGRAWGLV